MRGPYKTAPTPGTIADLIQRFRRSPTYNGWAETTRRANERYLGALMVANGRKMVAEVRRGDIVSMRDELADVPNTANSWLKCVKLLFGYAVEIDLLDFSPAATVKKLAVPNPDGFRTWRDDEIQKYLDHHAPGTLAHLVMTMAVCTAAARCDLVQLGPANVRGDRLVYRRQKLRGRPAPEINIPILPLLAEALALLPPGRETFLAVQGGERRSEKSLGGDFAAWVKAAGLNGRDEYGRTLSLHGLRKAMARRLAEAGATPQSIMATLGHASIAMAARYSAAYDRARAADVGMEKLAAAETAPPKVVRIRRKKK